MIPNFYKEIQENNTLIIDIFQRNYILLSNYALELELKLGRYHRDKNQYDIIPPPTWSSQSIFQELRKVSTTDRMIDFTVQSDRF